MSHTLHTYTPLSVSRLPDHPGRSLGVAPETLSLTRETLKLSEKFPLEL